MKILVTGAAGFIGYHLCKRLLSLGYYVTGVDNLNDYYDVGLKRARLKDLESNLYQNNALDINICDIADSTGLSKIFIKLEPDMVINLAAQAGVRYSIENPSKYIDSNLVGFANILECCRRNGVKHLIYASSSSVYGANKKSPFNELDKVDKPLSLYAATKKSNELMAYTYSHLYKIQTTGMRFFTVYGPWGRPDMALFLFTKAMLEGRPIQLFNHGNMVRAFTYIDDVIECIVRLIAKDSIDSNAEDTEEDLNIVNHKIFNVGSSKSVKLIEYVMAIEKSLEIRSIKEFLPLQQGDVAATLPDTSALAKYIGYQPKTPLEYGINQFVEWYKGYYA